MGELLRLGKANTTQILANETGGKTYSFARQSGLETTIEQLGEELHTKYLLSFTPDNPEAGRHSLKVSVAGKKDLQIRARRAYWSAQLP